MPDFRKITNYILPALICLLLVPFLAPQLLAQEGEAKGGKSIVVYFSATGNTARLAKIIADQTGADVYLIEPAEPFPATEQEIIKAEEARRAAKEAPVLKEAPPDLSGYGLVYLGSPVWFGEPSEIVTVFLSQADFKGAKVAIFATAGTRPGEVVATLSGLVKNGTPLTPGLVQKREDDQSEGALQEKVKTWLAAVNPAQPASK
jgi:flavodoxin